VRLLLVSVGRTKAGPERDLTERYLNRAATAGRGLGFTSIEQREIEESRARRPQDRKREEAKAIRGLLGARRESSPVTNPAGTSRAPNSPPISPAAAIRACRSWPLSSAGRTGSILISLRKLIPCSPSAP